MRLFSLLLCILSSLFASAQTVVNGVPWYDQNGNVVNAHGACIVKDNGRYWLFGEYKSDTTNCFPGFGCYSSKDLTNWQFERVVLPVQKDGVLGPNRVGERPKVMRCPKTGKYVMLAHADATNYNDPHTVVAIADSINGDYKLLGTLQYNGKPIHKWDIGTFQDDDGRAYLLVHHGPIYRMSDDYLSVDTMVANVKGVGESPAMFKKNGVYFLLTSNLTSWERNDNYYFTATNIAGPWTKRGLFCPEGTLTWNSQTTFVLMLPDGTPMYMGDRWSYPHQASCATYVWLPMKVSGTSLSIPEYLQVWEPLSADTLRPCKAQSASEIALNFSSDVVGKTIRKKFKGSQVILYGETNQHSGYGLVTISDNKGKVVYKQLVDFYSLVPSEGIRVVSPRLPKGKYELTVKVTGDKPNWRDKRRNDYGSTGYAVNVSKMMVI